MSTTVLVAGATGQLGSKTVLELVLRGADVRALVREGKEDGGDALRDLVATGTVTAVVGDLSDNPAHLAQHLEGVEVVVSAVQGGRSVVTDGQVNLLRAAEQAGVRRMIPSDFSVDLHRLDYGDSHPLDFRKEADEAFADSVVRQVSVLNGGFMEVMLDPFMGILDPDAGTFSFWGDGEQPMDFTSIPDTSAYTAAVALDPDAPRIVSVAGEVLTMRELHQVVVEATGQQLEVRELGTTDELRAEIERRKESAEDPFEYIPLQYQWAMTTGKAKLRDLDNDRYPDVMPISVAEFLAARR
jgi:uncharacterized protein YbjT (DUF2867 family)